MRLKQGLYGEKDTQAFLYEDTLGEGCHWVIRVYRGKRKLEEFSFVASPVAANEEVHIALARAEGVYDRIEQ